MRQIFVDAGYWIALEWASDTHHQRALSYWPKAHPAPKSFVTTSYVLDEVVAFLNGHSYHANAVRVGEDLLNSEIIQFIHIDETLFHAGWDYFKQHRDKQYSLTDCISFVVMAQLGITAALTFDRHFAQAGFTMVP